MHRSPCSLQAQLHLRNLLRCWRVFVACVCGVMTLLAVGCAAPALTSLLMPGMQPCFVHSLQSKSASHRVARLLRLDLHTAIRSEKHDDVRKGMHQIPVMQALSSPHQGKDLRLAPPQRLQP